MTKEKIIIAIVGMPGAGKSLTAKYLSSKGYPVLRFGDQTDIGLKKLNLPLTEENEKKYRLNLRKKLGMAAYAKKIEPKILKTLKTSSTIILDGLYSWEEYLYLIDKFPQLVLVCIYAEPQIRYQRLSKRKTRPLTKDQARARDLDELTDLNKGGPIAIADYLIKNHHQLKDLHAKLDEVLERIIGG